MDEIVDVAVVGAGPAGLAVARRTAAAGLETLVIERQREVAEHVRTSGMTALSTVAEAGAPAETFHVLETLRIAAPAATAVVPGGFCVLDVRGFYRWLAAEAIAAGARILLGATVRDVLTEDGAVAGCVVDVDGERRTVRARIVVDAGGHRAQVSKRAGLHPGFTRFGVGAEYELTAPHVDPTEAVLILGERHAPTGYAWSFPWGGERVRLGVGLHHADTRNDPKTHLARLLDEQGTLGLGLEGAAIAEYHYGLIPAERTARQLTGDGILAVGDAAGQASLVVGEGIRISLRAGEAAGGAIEGALRAGRSDRAALEPYERWFSRTLARDLRVGAVLNRRLAAARDDARWNRRVELLATMPPELVVDLLQSKVRMRALTGWTLRNPRRALASGALLRAVLGGPERALLKPVGTHRPL